MAVEAKKKNKGGRPRKGADCRKHTLAVRMNDRELERLQDLVRGFNAKYPDGPDWLPADVMRRGISIQWQASRYSVEED